jgi:pimeloyl-ACP methyl ester carboxylesterase
MISKKLSALCLLSLLTSYAQATPVKPTMLLVHGALFTSSGWFEVQSHLQNAGYNVVTMDVPGRAGDGIAYKEVTLSSAVEKVCKVAHLQPEPVVLVGHSQGGALITQALNKCGDKVKALVYVTAVVPLNGEKAFDNLSKSDQDNFEKDATLDEKNAVFRLNYHGPIKATFMADATSGQFKRALHDMVSEPAKIGDEPLHYPVKLFASLPKFYIETTEDQIISLDTQRQIESKTHFNKIYSMHASHSPMVSQAKKLATHLMDIVDSL